MLGTVNRVLYKIMTVPMGHYSYFLSNFNSICYTLCYFVILFVRFRLGKVTWDMLRYVCVVSHEMGLCVQCCISCATSMPVRGLTRSVAGCVCGVGVVRCLDRHPKWKLILIGSMDSLGSVLGLIGAAHLSGPLVVLLPNVRTPRPLLADDDMVAAVPFC